MAPDAPRWRTGVPAQSSLVKRNIIVAGHRTSARLEPVMWEALHDIAGQQGTSLNELVTRIDSNKKASSLTAAIRVFIVKFYRAAPMRDAADDKAVT